MWQKMDFKDEINHQILLGKVNEGELVDGG